MIKKYLIEVTRWSLRFHGILHVGHVYSDFIVGNWVGVGIGSYIIAIELLSSFLIPKEHVHFKAFKTEVHEECDNK